MESYTTISELEALLVNWGNDGGCKVGGYCGVLFCWLFSGRFYSFSLRDLRITLCAFFCQRVCGASCGAVFVGVCEVNLFKCLGKRRMGRSAAEHQIVVK